MTPYGATPEWLKPLFAEIQNRPDAKLADFEILEKGIDPARARRWFKKHHGMTFHSYMRSLRISKAFGQIKHDETIMNTALDSGFDSLSGFGDAFKKTTGFAPSESRKNRIISITRILTPLGPMFAGAVEEGICLLEFSDRRMLETQLSRIKKAFKAKIVPGDHPHFVELNRQLKAYFSGELREFDLPLQLTATQFQQDVWNALVKIPYSETRSYQEQAVSIGKPKAVRAVATANGDNRISIIIPCHRVIGKNGSLTGYGGGLWRKRYLLDLEKKNARQNL